MYVKCSRCKQLGYLISYNLPNVTVNRLVVDKKIYVCSRCDSNASEKQLNLDKMIGRTVASVERVEGEPSYWVITFDNDSEITFVPMTEIVRGQK